MQLKLYAESPSSIKKIKVTDSYYAQACDETILVSTIEGNSRRLLKLTICTSIATTVIATLIVVSVGMLIGCNHRSCMKSKCIAKLERRNPAIFALTVVSVFANVYMFCLSWTAMSTWEQHCDSALTSGLFDLSEINYINRSSIGFLVVFNTISVLCSITILGIVAGFLCFKLKDSETLQKIRILRLVSVLCACLSICAHSPYIAIAYLNNENHATGIFIYYSLLGCLLFGLSWIVFHYYYSSSQSEGEMNNTKKNGCGHNFLQSLNKYCKRMHKLLIIVALVFIICMTLVFFVVFTCFFIMIPINKSISEFPNRVVGIYMSGGFIISTFLLYKLFVYLCHKNKQHRSNTTSSQQESDGPTLGRVSTKKLEDLWRDRTDSERKCEEYIVLKRIEENLATNMQSTDSESQDSPKAGGELEGNTSESPNPSK